MHYCLICLLAIFLLRTPISAEPPPKPVIKVTVEQVKSTHPTRDQVRDGFLPENLFQFSWQTENCDYVLIKGASGREEGPVPANAQRPAKGSASFWEGGELSFIAVGAGGIRQARESAYDTHEPSNGKQQAYDGMIHSYKLHDMTRGFVGAPQFSLGQTEAASAVIQSTMSAVRSFNFSVTQIEPDPQAVASDQTSKWILEAMDFVFDDLIGTTQELNSPVVSRRLERQVSVSILINRSADSKFDFSVEPTVINRFRKEGPSPKNPWTIDPDSRQVSIKFVTKLQLAIEQHLKTITK